LSIHKTTQKESFFVKRDLGRGYEGKLEPKEEGVDGRASISSFKAHKRRGERELDRELRTNEKLRGGARTQWGTRKEHGGAQRTAGRSEAGQTRLFWEIKKTENEDKRKQGWVGGGRKK